MQSFKTSKAKENILRKIRKGLHEASTPMPFPEVDKESIAKVFAGSDMSPEERFATEFIKLGGKFVFCENEQELLDDLHVLYDQRGWQQLLCSEQRLLNVFQNNKLDFVQQVDPKAAGADACITSCEMLVARTGSVVFSSKEYHGRVAPVFYPVHIIVAYAHQVVDDLQQGITLMKERYGNNLPSMINLNTGPSRTADIEKTLVVGIHGPKEVFCFLINS
ncbi:LutC/YkgG family protein [Taibaiella soli]|uniref:Lactate utilization protein B/C n=1 Tax=Taibaiella soli TaxID=1649169 RepID=A0A2W2AXJ4_9BACT|nr:lactate utilization protein [Taibaiella soli]PZF72388.1 lactate utilization protein B/C [Taibaiella soli]